MKWKMKMKWNEKWNESEERKEQKDLGESWKGEEEKIERGWEGKDKKCKNEIGWSKGEGGVGGEKLVGMFKQM